VYVIGTSGSGKSTLLHLLAGVDKATGGSIIINGKDITKLDQDALAVFRRREVGIIYQFFNLVPVLTARENIELPIMLDEKSIDKAYFNEIVELLGIKDRLDFYPSKLSGGEQQRVAIARALIHRPSIILADEPTGNLNSKLAKEIMEFLVLASKRYNQTIIMITHDLNLAKYADRVIEIQDGYIVKDYETTEDMEVIKETETEDRSKKEIVQTMENKINAIVYEAEQTEKEAWDETTGNYIIDYTQWMNVVYSIYTTIDRKNLAGEMMGMDELREDGSTPDSLMLYYKMFKESLKAFDKGNKVILMNTKRMKAKETFSNKEEMYEYFDKLATRRAMIPPRVKQLKAYLDDVSDDDEG